MDRIGAREHQLVACCGALVLVWVGSWYEKQEDQGESFEVERAWKRATRTDLKWDTY
jgi:hypothetical protein